MDNVKRTPLYDLHLRLGGRMVEFGGWMLPVQYSGIKEEHNAVRTRAGLFDVSHMGEFELSGANALVFLQCALTNDFQSLAPGKIRYSPMCYEHGGTVDDLLVYCMGENQYILVVNASRADADFEHLSLLAKEFQGVSLENVSATYAQIALQGPLAMGILSKVCQSAPEKYYTFIHDNVAGIPCIISRTGYTGEDGVELYCAANQAEALYIALKDAGGEDILPCGLGARDTLRFECSMPLYGHELSDSITPLEAGLNVFVKPQKDEFIGKAALESEAKRSRVGLKMLERGIAREGYRVQNAAGEDIGYVTSGMFAPTTGENLAMALITNPAPAIGETVSVIIRDKPVKADVVKMPFYKRNK